MSETERQQAENEKANGEALGSDNAVQAAEKRLAALGGVTDAEPTEAKPARSRQTKRA